MSSEISPQEDTADLVDGSEVEIAEREEESQVTDTVGLIVPCHAVSGCWALPSCPAARQGLDNNTYAVSARATDC